MSKTSVFTSITPLPAGVTRQSVLDMYHNHLEMIDLNPLVIERFNCKPPNFAPAEEYYSTWYTIKDKVSYLPGNFATGSVTYHACFHDLSDGLQTHVYAPLGLDIRAKWSVGGSLPGEPKQPAEMGLDIPAEGLYIREDVKMKCNIMMISFVKKTFKESHSKLVDRLVERAHDIEAKVANERLNSFRTTDSRERTSSGDVLKNYGQYPGSRSDREDTRAPYQQDYRGDQRAYASHDHPNQIYSPHQRQQQRPEHIRNYSRPTQGYQPAPVELPSEIPPVRSKANQGFAAELPG